MGLAVELYFDGAAERAVRGVWEAVRAASGSSRLFDLASRPHVSLAVYSEGVRGPLEGALAAFRAAPLPFVLASVGTFPGAEGAVFLAPVADEALLRMHAAWHAGAPQSHEYYRPGAWVPHCTVGFNLAEAAIAPALAAARAALPIRGRFESIGIIEYEPPAPIRRLAERRL
jgi:2'-5' RNA ligase